MKRVLLYVVVCIMFVGCAANGQMVKIEKMLQGISTQQQRINNNQIIIANKQQAIRTELDAEVKKGSPKVWALYLGDELQNVVKESDLKKLKKEMKAWNKLNPEKKMTLKEVDIAPVK